MGLLVVKLAVVNAYIFNFFSKLINCKLLELITNTTVKLKSVTIYNCKQ
jgi:hypothetical protein